jgi:RNA polymerase sigma factor for flagellar operon FliA
VGLYDAGNKYDPSKGVEFKTYAEYRIGGAMLDALRQEARARQLITRSAMIFHNLLHKTTLRLWNSLKREPTEEELWQELELPEEEFCQLRSFALQNMNMIASLELNLVEAPAELGPEEELLKRNDFYGKTAEQIKAQSAAFIDDNGAGDNGSGICWIVERLLCCSELSDKALYCFFEYFWHGRTLKEIGLTDFGETESNICLLKNRAVRELKKPRSMKMIKDLLEGNNTEELREIIRTKPTRTFSQVISRIREEGKKISEEKKEYLAKSQKEKGKVVAAEIKNLVLAAQPIVGKERSRLDARVRSCFNIGLRAYLQQEKLPQTSFYLGSKKASGNDSANPVVLSDDNGGKQEANRVLSSTLTVTVPPPS